MIASIVAWTAMFPAAVVTIIVEAIINFFWDLANELLSQEAKASK